MNHDTVGLILKHIMEIVDEVPFGNSDHQNRTSVVNAEMTPARAYRHAALRITNRVLALQEASFELQKRGIEIEILTRDMLFENDGLKRKLMEIEIEKKKSSLPYTKKLAKDALAEIKSLWPIIQAIGPLSRESFESEEKEHHRIKNKQPSIGHDLYEAIVSQPTSHTILSVDELISLAQPLGQFPDS